VSDKTGSESLASTVASIGPKMVRNHISHPLKTTINQKHKSYEQGNIQKGLFIFRLEKDRLRYRRFLRDCIAVEDGHWGSLAD